MPRSATTASSTTSATKSQKAASTRARNRQKQLEREQAIAAAAETRGPRKALTQAKANAVWLDTGARKRLREPSTQAQPGEDQDPEGNKRRRTSQTIQGNTCFQGSKSSHHLSRNEPLKIRSHRRIVYSDESEDDAPNDHGAESDAPPPSDGSHEAEDEDVELDAAENDPALLRDILQNATALWNDEPSQTAPSNLKMNIVNDAIDKHDEESDIELERAMKRGARLSKAYERELTQSRLNGTDTNKQVDTNTNRRMSSNSSSKASNHAKPTRREQRVRDEEPLWGDNSDGDGHLEAQMGHAGGERDHEDHPLPESTTADAADIPTTGRGNVSRRNLNSVLRDILQAAQDAMQVYVLFTNAYPDTEGPTRKFKWLRSFLISAAQSRGRQDIAQRFSNDYEFVKPLVSSLSTNLSQFRARFKSAVDSKIMSHYSLQSADRVQRGKRLIKSASYILPGDIMGTVDAERPYEHPIFADVIGEVLFRSRHLPGIKFADKFIVDWQGERHKEVPRAMLALVATAIFAALSDFNTKKTTHFSAEAYGDAYKGHVRALERLESKWPRWYHRVMEEMFQTASDESLRFDNEDQLADDILACVDESRMRDE